jgi:hypothetical protein
MAIKLDGGKELEAGWLEADYLITAVSSSTKKKKRRPHLRT